jgi:hypothetical protein
LSSSAGILESVQSDAYCSKIYIQSAVVSALNLSLSFLPAPWHIPDELVSASSHSCSSQSLVQQRSRSSLWRAGHRYSRITAQGRHNHAGRLGGNEAVASPAGVMGGGRGGMLRVLLSLAQMEGAWVQLQPLQLNHPLVTPEALGQVVAGHYLR